LCPKCGGKTLFKGVIEFAPSCRACGLDISAFNVGDGPAAFLTMIISTLVIILSLSVESAWHPPFWVHVLLWVPFTIGAVIWGLRAAKAALLAAEYRTNAGEGRLEE
jgi:uncharacterized protein (DUF983 family)